MAFFTLEDRYAEIECLAFPKFYQSNSDVIRADAAACVWGTISYRENEEPKLLVDKMLMLVDNETYVDTSPSAEPQAEQTDRPRMEMPSTSALREQAPNYPSMPSHQIGDVAGKKLYLRLPDSHGLIYRKTMALVEILEGNVPVVFYDSAAKSYQAYRGGIALTDYAYGELVRLLGEGNVVLK
jgi:DNA polymerase-3 subunit alpha